VNVRVGRHEHRRPKPAGEQSDPTVPGRHRHSNTVRDVGSATAELAVCLPALVLLLATGLMALTAMRTQIECVDVAREAARSAARGDPVAPGRPGASVSVTTDGDVVRATVVVRFSPGGGLPGFDITATSVAAAEPT
jgi:hypothetical protein